MPPAVSRAPGRIGGRGSPLGARAPSPHQGTAAGGSRGGAPPGKMPPGQGNYRGLLPKLGTAGGGCREPPKGRCSREGAHLADTPGTVQHGWGVPSPPRGAAPGWGVCDKNHCCGVRSWPGMGLHKGTQTHACARTHTEFRAHSWGTALPATSAPLPAPLPVPILSPRKETAAPGPQGVAELGAMGSPCWASSDPRHGLIPHLLASPRGAKERPLG